MEKYFDGISRENKKTCERCYGNGEIEFFPTSVPRKEKMICPDCHGKGYIVIERNQKFK